MWSTVARMFLAASVLPGSRILDSPTNLSLGHESPTHVALYWNFTEPKYTDVADIHFDLLLRDGKDSLEWFRRESHGEPFHFILIDLEPNTEYTLKLWASHPKFKSSAMIEQSFTTMQEDWATPVITNVTSKQLRDSVNYTLSWEFPHKSNYLSHFDVVVCAYACHGTIAGPHDSNATVSVPLYTSFSLNVDAFYDVPVVGTVKRESNPFDGYSAMGEPAKVEHLTKISQIGNQFIIHWIPPRPSNGPLSYHEVLIYDPMQPLRASWSNVTMGAGAILTAPAIQGDLYKIKIRAVNVDSDGTIYKGEFATFDFEREAIPKTVEVEVLHRHHDFVHFRVLTAHPQDNMIFDIEAPVSLRRIYGTIDEFEAIDLKPYQKFSIDVRPCYPTADSNVHTCAEFSRFKVVSNVASPSEIRNLNVQITEDDFIIAKWQPPKLRNGPIDKYEILYQFKEQGSEESRSFEYRDQTTYVRHKRPREWREIWVGITAVNFDLDDVRMVHASRLVGTEAVEWRPPQDEKDLTMVIVALSALVIVIIILRCSDLMLADLNPEHAGGDHRQSPNPSRDLPRAHGAPPAYQTPPPPYQTPPPLYVEEMRPVNLREIRAPGEPAGVAEQAV